MGKLCVYKLEHVTGFFSGTCNIYIDADSTAGFRGIATRSNGDLTCARL
jgi:hypothetical protein